MRVRFRKKNIFLLVNATLPVQIRGFTGSEIEICEPNQTIASPFGSDRTRLSSNLLKNRMGSVQARLDSQVTRTRAHPYLNLSEDLYCDYYQLKFS